MSPTFEADEASQLRTAIRTQPFGGISAAEERAALKHSYDKFFFKHVPYVSESRKAQTYLFVGWRGAGKSSLIESYRVSNQRVVQADCGKLYELVTQHGHTSDIEQAGASSTARLWKALFWLLVFQELYDESAACKAIITRAGLAGVRVGSPSQSVFALTAEKLVARLSEWAGVPIAMRLDQLLTSEEVEEGKEAARQLASKRPIVLAIDSLEKYNPADKFLMNMTAGLVEAASEFLDSNVGTGIGIKVFIAREVWSDLEVAVPNYAKHVRRVVWLQWTPDMLVRLLCYRYDLYLQLFHSESGASSSAALQDWDDVRSVRAALWNPYFGRVLQNGRGIREDSLAYVMRHTQLRPRQLVQVCNTIARVAAKLERERSKTRRPALLPRFEDDEGGAVVKGVREFEREACKELENSYSTMFPRVQDILARFRGTEVVTRVSELHKLAPATASLWPKYYSKENFVAMASKLGVIGRIWRDSTDAQTGVRHIQAEFEYATKEPLRLQEDELIALHPMWCNHLEIRSPNSGKQDVVVHPFTDAQEFDFIRPAS